MYFAASLNSPFFPSLLPVVLAWFWGITQLKPTNNRAKYYHLHTSLLLEEVLNLVLLKVE
jgi:hypothetical protein